MHQKPFGGDRLEHDGGAYKPQRLGQEGKWKEVSGGRKVLPHIYSSSIVP